MTLLFSRTLNQFKCPGNNWCTASALGSTNGCLRSLIIDNYFRHNGMYESVHLKFGNALGAACSALVRNYSKHKYVRFAHAYDSARKYLRASEYLPGKDWSKLWRAINTFDRFWAGMHKKGWRYHSSELRKAIEILQPDGDSSYILGGAYDLKVELNTGDITKYLIVDFKSTSSVFYHNYNHNVQIPIYMLLDCIHEVADGHPMPEYVLPEYYVFEVGNNDSTLNFSNMQVLPSVLKSSLEGVLALHSMATGIAEKFETLIKSGKYDSAVKWLRSIPINASACQRGNFRCFHYSQCHENGLVNFAETRFSDIEQESVPTVKLTYDNVLQYIDKLAFEFETETCILPTEWDDIDSDSFDINLLM